MSAPFRVSLLLLQLPGLALALYFAHGYIGVVLSQLPGLFQGRPWRLGALLASSVLISAATAAVFGSLVATAFRRHAMLVALAACLPTAVYRVWSIAGSSRKPFLVAALLLEGVTLAVFVPLLAGMLAKRRRADPPGAPQVAPLAGSAGRNPYAPPASRVADVGVTTSMAAGTLRLLRLAFAALVLLQFVALLMYGSAHFEDARAGTVSPVALLGTLTGSACLYVATVLLVQGRANGRVTFVLAAVLLASTLPAWSFRHPSGWNVALGAALAVLGSLLAIASSRPDRRGAPDLGPQ